MASTDSNRVTIYTGSEVNVQHLKMILEKAGIDTMVMNNFESGLRSGFGGGLPGQVQLQVWEEHKEKAQKIAEATFPSQAREKEEEE